MTTNAGHSKPRRVKRKWTKIIRRISQLGLPVYHHRQYSTWPGRGRRRGDRVN